MMFLAQYLLQGRQGILKKIYQLSIFEVPAI